MIFFYCEEIWKIKQLWNCNLNHFRQLLFYTFPPLMNLIFFVLVLMPRILNDREEGNKTIKFWFFSSSSYTSIFTHKLQSDRRIWNFHVLVPIVHPNIKSVPTYPNAEDPLPWVAVPQVAEDGREEHVANHERSLQQTKVLVLKH